MKGPDLHTLRKRISIAFLYNYSTKLLVNKKILLTFVGIVKYDTSTIFQRKIINPFRVRASKVSIFSTIFGKQWFSL